MNLFERFAKWWWKPVGTPKTAPSNQVSGSGEEAEKINAELAVKQKTKREIAEELFEKRGDLIEKYRDMIRDEMIRGAKEEREGVMVETPNAIYRAMHPGMLEFADPRTELVFDFHNIFDYPDDSYYGRPKMGYLFFSPKESFLSLTPKEIMEDIQKAKLDFTSFYSDASRLFSLKNLEEIIRLGKVSQLLFDKSDYGTIKATGNYGSYLNASNEDIDKIVALHNGGSVSSDCWVSFDEVFERITIKALSEFGVNKIRALVTPYVSPDAQRFENAENFMGFSCYSVRSDHETANIHGHLNGRPLGFCLETSYAYKKLLADEVEEFFNETMKKRIHADDAHLLNHFICTRIR